MNRFTRHIFAEYVNLLLHEIQSLTLKNTDVLRTKQNYQSDIVRPDPTQSEIKEECIFHRIDDYRILDNTGIDFLYDLLEGIVAYVMFALVKHLIFEAKYFDLEYLNAKIKALNFGVEEDYNKPSSIFNSRLKENTTLKMSAEQVNVNYTSNFF